MCNDRIYVFNQIYVKNTGKNKNSISDAKTFIDSLIEVGFFGTSAVFQL